MAKPVLKTLVFTVPMLVGILASTGGLATAAGTPYTALGDSIAYGMGATNNYGYVSHFRDHLTSVYGSVALSNRGVPGMTSSDLTTQLAIDYTTRTAVKNAQVLTISIGGNNLLRCASNNYSVIDTTCSANGANTFKNDWPKILDTVRNGLGSNAKLYVLSLYNPYRGDEPNFAMADPYIKQINSVIQNSTTMAKYNYKVADAYTDFSGRFADGSWKVSAWTHFSESTRDPHPTNAGHQELSRLHEAIFN